MQNLLYSEKRPPLQSYATAFKPLFDRLLGFSGFVMSLPFLAVIGFLVRFKIGSPVLLRESRAGYKGKTITLYKFRTVSESASSTLPDKERLTPFGLFLRRTGLDELPQLFNILRGDLSVIGPRPLLVEYLPLYNAEQARRHDVRPGMTGLAQVSKARGLKWEDTFSLDTYYADHISLSLDLKILWWTVMRSPRPQEIEAQRTVTAPAVKGAQPGYIKADVVNEVLISETDWRRTPAAVRSACQVMTNRISVLDRQLDNAHAEREIYRTQMLDMKVRLEAALSMLQLSLPIDISPDKADTWLDDPETQPTRPEPIVERRVPANDMDLLRIINRTVTQDSMD